MPIYLSRLCGDVAPDLKGFVKVESSLKDLKVEMEDSGMQTQGHENIATGSPDDSAQVEEQAVPSNPVAVIRDQNDRIPADNGAGRDSNLILVSTVAGAPQTTRARPYHLFETVHVVHARLPPIGSHTLAAMRRFETGTSLSGRRYSRSVTVPCRTLRDGKLVVIVPEECDDGDISEELRNAVAAGNDAPAGHIRVDVIVRSKCPIPGCRSTKYARFMAIVSPADAPTRLSQTTTAYFHCFRHGCDITFGLQEDTDNPFDGSSRFPCPQCSCPLATTFLFRSRFWKRFTRHPCGGEHGTIRIHRRIKHWFWIPES